MIDKTVISKAAQAYAAKGQIDKAIAEWERLLREQPDGNTYNVIGDLYLRKKAKSDAVEAFSKAADIFREEGFSLKAIALYKKILNISPLEVEALVSLGELNAEKGLIGNAKDNLSSAADIYLKEGSPEQALEIYEKIVQLAPVDVPLKLRITELHLDIGLKEEGAKGYVSIGSDYLEKGEIEKAREYYEKALQCHPQSTPAYIGLSRIEEMGGDVNKAYEQLKGASSFAHEDCDFLTHFVRLSSATGDLENVKQALIKLTELKPSDLTHKKQLGILYLDEGLLEKAWNELRPYVDERIQGKEWDESLELLEKFKDIDPVEVRQRLVTVYKGKNDTDSAIREMKSLAGICESKDFNEEALQVCRGVIELDPADEDMMLKIKELEKKLGIEEPASDASIEGKSPDEVLAAVHTHVLEGRFSEAAVMLERLIEEEPENLTYHKKLKDVYVGSGDKARAVDECIVIAKLHEKNENFTGKSSVLAEAISLSPDDPRLAELSTAEEIKVSSGEETDSPEGETAEDIDEVLAEADFYAQQGLKEEAINIYRKILSANPNNTEVRERLSALQPDGAPAEEDTVEAHVPPDTEIDSELKDIFHEFKKGIDQELGDGDGDSRYDLGIAYKEMGLLDDAIKEFKIAEKDPGRALQSASMLALCYMDKQQYADAIKEFKRVLELMSPEDKGFLGAKCDLADALVKNREFQNALALYNDIQRQDPKFRDVEKKISIIQSMDLREEEKKDKLKSKKDRVSYI